MFGNTLSEAFGPRIDRGGRQKKVTPMKCWLAVCVALGWLRPLPVSRRRQIGSGLLAIGVVPVFGIAAVAGTNFVPVDWVSSMIAQGVLSPAARGRTYHLTHPEPVPMAAAAEVVQEAVETNSPAAAPGDPEACDEEWFAENFSSQLDIYRTYLRSDPIFDRGHAAVLGAGLPCPALDKATLMRMAKFAIDNDFGRRGPSVKPLPTAAAVHSPPCLARS
jgi:hypothetical protein